MKNVHIMNSDVTSTCMRPRFKYRGIHRNPFYTNVADGTYDCGKDPAVSSIVMVEYACGVAMQLPTVH